MNASGCLIDRPAWYQPCPRCGHHTLAALVSGHKIRCDPEALNINQEIAALLMGKQTYDILLIGLPRRMQPVWRDISRIRATRRYLVIADHRCNPGAQRPAIPGPEIEITVPRPSAPDSETPPF